MKRFTIFILVLLIFVMLNAQTTYTVGDETGYDFDNIQDAIYEAYITIGSVSILVSDGEYDKIKISNTPTSLTNLTIESENGFEDCIIDANQEGNCINIHKSRNVSIVGFTVQGAYEYEDEDGNGAYIDSSFCVVVDTCYFANNISTGSGGGIYAFEDSSLTIINNHFYNNNTSGAGGAMYIGSSSYKIWHNLIEYNEANMGGGIYIVGKGASAVTSSVNFNDIIHNTASYSGGGLYSSESYFLCKSNCVLQNSANYGGGIYFHLYVNNDYTEFCGNLISFNTVTSSGGGIYMLDSQLDMASCTVADNNCTAMDSYGGGIFRTADSGLNSINSILWNNYANAGTQIYVGVNSNNVIQLNISYTCIQGGITGIEFEDPEWVEVLNYENGNITSNPVFASTSPSNEDYCHLTIFSPCLDGGSPYFPLDPDGTIIDMGCFYFPHEGDVIQFDEGVHWVSFPRIGLETNNNYYLESDLVDILDQEINPWGDITYINVYSQGSGLDYDYQNPPDYWTPSDYPARSSNLYKIEVLPYDDYRYLEIDGEKLADDYSYLETEPLASYTEQWLGYWLSEPRNIVDAFGVFWEYVEEVWSEDWYYNKCSNNRGIRGAEPVSWSSANKTLEYGKGYIVQFERILEIEEFCWTPSSTVEEPKKKSETENFDFEEKPDYEVIDVVDIPENVAEIGVYQNDACVGAVVVTDASEQILVYSDNASREPIPFNFEVITNGRSINLPVNNYEVYNEDTGEFENGFIVAGQQRSSIIKFGNIEDPQPETPIIGVTQLHGNYPNPFNPETSISFSIPAEQNVELTIYNLKGQQVKTLYSGLISKGVHSLVWEGKDNNGKQVGSGLYFYKLKTNDKEISKKMLLLK